MWHEFSITIIWGSREHTVHQMGWANSVLDAVEVALGDVGYQYGHPDVVAVRPMWTLK